MVRDEFPLPRPKMPGTEDRDGTIRVIMPWLLLFPEKSVAPLV